MGEVYRARDARLNRDVAVKVLPEVFAHDPDRLARFTREAQALGALNHPNIAQIYGLEDAGGTPALVMEFVDGQTLADLVRARSAAASTAPVPVAEVAGLAREIAAGLEVAHERGIVHRDLKPANVKVTSEGHVKILDFGLAKALATDPTGSEAMNSPTLTARATEVGMILGTAAYMSPEQARGKAVDKRADIWAFGAVVYELLTGQRAFPGETVSDTLASVLKTEPDWTQLPADTPLYLQRLLRRCLERDPSKRLRDIGEARVALEQGDMDREPVSGVSRAAAPVVPPPPVPWFQRPLPWMVATLALAATSAGAFYLRPAPAASRPFELSIAPPDGAEFLIGSNLGSGVISPDGASLVFDASTPQAPAGLWIRSLSRNDAHPLPNTIGGYYPFWSPDSRRVGFFADGKLKIIDVASGLPEAVAEAKSGRGAAWTQDGTIVFTPVGGGPIFRVAATGGPVSPVTHLDAARGENADYWPVLLPGDKTFLYFIRSSTPENNGIYIGNVDGTGTPTRIATALSSALYAPPASGGLGHLLWVRDGELIAQSLDLSSKTLVGPVVTVASHVRVDESQRGMLASLSRTGVLVWADARAADVDFEMFDRDGRRLRQLPVEAGQLFEPLFSPNGSELAFMRAVAGGGHIWTHDLAAGTTRSLASDSGYTEQPTWSPDGRRVAYINNVGGRQTLRVAALDGSTASQTVVVDTESGAQWSGDGRFLLYSRNDPNTGFDVWAQPVGRSGQGTQLTRDIGAESALDFSPGGRWVAIGTSASGIPEVYLTRFLVDGDVPRLGTQRVTIGRLGSVFWSRNGREILAESVEGDVISIPVSETGEVLTVGKQTTLFKLPPSGSGGWAPSPDGSRFVVSEAPKANGQSLHVLTDWTSRLPR
jgi:serine/threonine protein kinase